MGRFVLLLLVFLGHGPFTGMAQQNPLPPLGQWRVHLPHRSLVELATNGQDIAAWGKNGGFVYTPANGQYQYLNTQNVLSQLGLRFVQWDATNQQWVLAYANGSIDLVQGKTRTTLSDFSRFVSNGNKTIQGLDVQKGKAYLATGLGMAVLDLANPHPWSLWSVVPPPLPAQVNAHTENQQFHYVGGTAGLFRAKQTDPLNQSVSWENISGQKGLPLGAVAQTMVWNNRVLAQVGRQLWTFNDSTNWFPVLTDTSWDILALHVAKANLLVTQNKGQNSRVLVVQPGGGIDQILSSPTLFPALQKAVAAASSVWLADRETGLWEATNAPQNFTPNGPLGMPVGEVVNQGPVLVFASGAAAPASPPNKNGLQFLENDTWTYYNGQTNSLLDTVFNWTSLAHATADGSLWAGTQAHGLVWKKAQETKRFDARNSGLENSPSNPANCPVNGVWASPANDVWVSNPGPTQTLKLRQANGNWFGFRPPFSLTTNGLGKLMGDAAGNIWAIAPGLGLVAYHPGNSSSSASDDRWKLFQPGSGQGNLPDPNVYSMVVDKDGSIWVGTGDGLALVVCSDQLYQGNACDAILPVVQQGAFSGRLLQQETVLSLAVDGANRKWAGTRNGAYWLSPDGKTVLAHFTVQNSPLLSNEIQQIGIVPHTGEVFFATTEGLSSYRSLATEASANPSVSVYPNPVPPGYNGLIGIRGLPENSWVKITELNGRLVAQTRSLGGQAIWDGRDASGRHTAPGVYLVLARDSSGKEKIATKIVKTSQ